LNSWWHVTPDHPWQLPVPWLFLSIAKVEWALPLHWLWELILQFMGEFDLLPSCQLNKWCCQTHQVSIPYSIIGCILGSVCNGETSSFLRVVHHGLFLIGGISPKKNLTRNWSNFWGFQSPKFREIFSSIRMFGFFFLAKITKGWLKYCTSYLVYCQIWLNLPLDDSHFFCIFRWMIATFGYKQKFLKKHWNFTTCSPLNYEFIFLRISWNISYFNWFELARS
jgi:hypothetical protein